MARRCGAAAALIVALALALAAVEAAERRFSFQAAEFLSEDQARAAGEAWMRSFLPAGLPISEAVKRAKAAGMTCRGPNLTAADVRCRSSMVVHEPGGVIGEDSFRLSLTPGDAGRLAQASLSYTRDGVPY